VHKSRTLHAPRKGDHVLSADYVRAERALKSGIKRDVARTVDDDVDIVGNSLCFFFGVAEVRISDVAAQYHDLAADESVQR
jgi:hypothetical protein